MREHEVTLKFIYDHGERGILNRSSAVSAAIKDLENISPHELEFDYRVIYKDKKIMKIRSIIYTIENIYCGFRKQKAIELAIKNKKDIHCTEFGTGQVLNKILYSYLIPTYWYKVIKCYVDFSENNKSIRTIYCGADFKKANDIINEKPFTRSMLLFKYNNDKKVYELQTEDYTQMHISSKLIN